MGRHRYYRPLEDMESKVQILIALIGLLLLAGCDDVPDSEPAVEAEAVLYKTEYLENELYSISNQQIGIVRFSEVDGVGTVEVELDSMRNDLQAIHLHAGSCEAPGAHWNCNGASNNFCREDNLGTVWGKPKAGDIGNVRKLADGSGYLTLKTDLWTLKENDIRSILGTVVILHDQMEDFAQSCFAGHTHAYGIAKIACGTIQLTSLD
jgi:Cu-Zn family superoxide dismutase